MPIKKLKRLLSSPGTMTAKQRAKARYREKCRMVSFLDEMKLILDSEDKLKPWLLEEMRILNMNTQTSEKPTETTLDDTDDTDGGLDDDVKDMWENPRSILGD